MRIKVIDDQPLRHISKQSALRLERTGWYTLNGKELRKLKTRITPPRSLTVGSHASQLPPIELPRTRFRIRAVARLTPSGSTYVA